MEVFVFNKKFRAIEKFTGDEETKEERSDTGAPIIKIGNRSI